MYKEVIKFHTYALPLFVLFIAMVILLTGCGKRAEFVTSQPCTVEDTEEGAVILCKDMEPVLISDGKDGKYKKCKKHKKNHKQYGHCDE
jgi:hypothetical protein